MRPPRLAVVAAVLLASGCATMKVPAPPLTPAPITWEQKLGWIVRLEDQRLLRDPNPPAPVILEPAGPARPAVVAPPPPSDLIRLLADPEARVRRRAALALGRVRLPEAVAPLIERLTDEEPEVRQMAAFALGLIGDPSTRAALRMALADASPIVKGRAAEALGRLGDRADAAAVAQMVRSVVAPATLAAIGPDELGYPLDAPVEAARLGIFALARLGSYDALASAVLDGAGQPVTRWWPVAYALQRAGDVRAVPALVTLLTTPGRYTAAQAIRGLAASGAASAAGAEPLRAIVARREAPSSIILQAVRALAALQDAAAVPMLSSIAVDPRGDALLRAEAIAALGAVRAPETLDLMLDLLSDPVAPVRAATMRALAQVDADAFLLALSGLDPDREWSVRVAQAAALGGLPAGRGSARLLAMLQDRDQRVIAAVLPALVASRVADAERVLRERLSADDISVRIAAAGGLAELKATGSVAALVDAYRRSAADTSYVARAAILSAVARLDQTSARPLLQAALADREWAMRVRAAKLLTDMGVADAQPARPAAEGRPVDDPAWQALVAPVFSPHAFIDTDRGSIEIELAVLDAPQTVANFIALARKGFFDGLPVHRVVPDFVVQAGDPRGDGEGGPGYTIRDEINERPYLRGTVGMALDWEDTGGSQFFITHAPQPQLDGRYTVFGSVVDGVDVVDRLQLWDVIRQVRIWDGVTMTPRLALARQP